MDSANGGSQINKVLFIGSARSFWYQIQRVAVPGGGVGGSVEWGGGIMTVGIKW
jgi:hypothetical protein